MTAADLQIGEKGVILELLHEELPLKLLEMGCLQGVSVVLLQMAPFKDPLYFEIGGTHIAIRKEMAAHIMVEKLD